MGSQSRDYEGWFLQKLDRISSTQYGVFFFGAVQDGENFHVSLRRWAQVDEDIWLACARFVGSFPKVEIHCGNVTLSGPEWLDHIAGRPTASRFAADGWENVSR